MNNENRNMNNEIRVNTGPGAVEKISVVLTVFFILFKLLNIIDWDWVFVIMPLWAGIILDVLFAMLLKLLFVVVYYINNKKKNKENRQ